MHINSNSLAIACASGSFKGVFAHGVLSALESAGVRANAYGASSASVLPTAWATIGKATELGVDYWLAGLRFLHQPNVGMSQVVLEGIAQFTPPPETLFAPDNPEYFVAVSAVITQEAANETQNEKAKRLGRRLLVSAGKKDRSWVQEHLRLDVFSTKFTGELYLHSHNFEQIAYASARMLHAWDVSAWIDGKPYIDASYTCLCPAMEMVEAGYQEVIAIANEPGTLYHDMFQVEAIPEVYKGVKIQIIQPDIDPKDLGVNFTDATEEGLLAVYEHGWQKGEKYLSI